MKKQCHLDLPARQTIELMLKEKKNFTCIGRSLSKHPTTISKEVLARRVTERRTFSGYGYNTCVKRKECRKSYICRPCRAEKRHKLCRNCPDCNSFCSEFEKEVCTKLSRPPYVCNGCTTRGTCPLEKKLYIAGKADSAYRKKLSESRSGTSFTDQELLHISSVVDPLIKQSQSPHHICVIKKNELTISERTLYRLIDENLIGARNLDLPRKVRYRKRKKSVHAKIDKKCREGRTMKDFQAFMAMNPGLPVVEMDSVEGVKGGKVLLTIHFVSSELMLAFIRDSNDAQSVIDIFNKLYADLGKDLFCRLFRVILTDNGTEFSNPAAIEYDPEGRLRTRIFYCDPNAPQEKGSAERNHEFIRCYIPKYRPFDEKDQCDISLMMDHINSYGRPSLGDKTPYEVFSFMYGRETADILGCKRILPEKVTLNRNIWKKEDNNGKIPQEHL